jgi:predicted Zn-dependent peptidase
MDSAIFELLKKTEFERHGNVLHNAADAKNDVARLCFVNEYETALEAREAELMLDFYLRAAKKGTVKHPTKDALTRAFRNARSKGVSLVTERRQNRLAFFAQVASPNEASLQHQLALADEILTEPLFTVDSELYEAAREEMADSIRDLVQHHEYRAGNLFNEQFFPLSEPMGEEEQLRRVLEARMEDLVGNFQLHAANSTPILIYSGKASVEEVQQQFAAFMKKYGGSREALARMENEVFLEVGESVHVEGPSEQWQLKIAYPLKETPRTDRDKVALKMFNKLLGGGWTAPLMQIVREEHHLVYGIYSILGDTKDVVAVVTNHHPDKYDQICQLTDGIVRDMVEGGFTDERFEEEREQMVERLVVPYPRQILTCDSPKVRVNKAFKNYVQGHDSVPAADEYRILSEITPGEVKEVAKSFIDPGKAQIFTYGVKK